MLLQRNYIQELSTMIKIVLAECSVWVILASQQGYLLLLEGFKGFPIICYILFIYLFIFLYYFLGLLLLKGGLPRVLIYRERGQYSVIGCGSSSKHFADMAANLANTFPCLAGCNTVFATCHTISFKYEPESQMQGHGWYNIYLY